MASSECGRQLVVFAGLGDVETAKSLIETERSVEIDSADDDGMTALMHSSYKGHVGMCRYLLDKGADVNSVKHSHQYSPLMFAGLSGSSEVTQLLLEAGALPEKENDIGKTASQLAGFVGNHQCVSVINNYIPKSQLEPFTVAQGLEAKPKLPRHLLPAVHRLIICTNLNPVYLLLYLSEHSDLLDMHASLVDILERLLEQNVKEMNEPLAFKMHYFTHVVRQAATHKDCPTEWMKRLLKGRESDGVLLNMEDFVRSSIRDFKYRDSQLLKSLVRNISTVTPGDVPSALYSLEQAVNNTRKDSDLDKCFACGTSVSDMKRCSACKEVLYCSVRCQKLHWFSHKKQCKQGQKDKRVASN